MNIVFSPTFIRKYKGFPPALQEEVKEKIALFRENPEHPFLRVHKLKGTLKGRHSFSVNYRYRIVFYYGTNKEAILLTVEDPAVYQ